MYYIVILSCFILLCQVQGQNTPVADAGADQNVAPGATVTLDGSGSSDADSDSLTYTWTEVSNFGITLTSPSPSSITFTLPNTLEETDILTFRLVVDDSKDGSAMDEVVVSNFNTDLLSGLTLTERISSSNIVHLATEGYDESSAIFAGKFNTSSSSAQVIYESGGGVIGTALLIDEIGGQLTFFVSTGNDNDVDISSAIDINTDYVYIVEITGATDGSDIHLYIAEGTSFSALDSVTPITNTITADDDSLSGVDSPSYLSHVAPSVSIQGTTTAGSFQGTASEILFFSNQKVNNFDLNLSDTSLLSRLSLTERINSSNLVHLENEGYDTSSMIFAGGFNTSSTSSQIIYEAGGTGIGTALRIDNVSGQLTFVVSTGTDGDIDISSDITVNTDYVYIVEITGATDGSVINLYIAEGRRFSALDSVLQISATITATSDDLSGSDASSYVTGNSFTQGNGVAPLGTGGAFQGIASEIFFFSNQNVYTLPVANAGSNQNVSAGTSVTLDGSGSSVGVGQSLVSYTWTLISGSGVTIADPNVASFSFTLPDTVIDTETLTFGLVVSDGMNNSVSDEITVSNFNAALLSGLTLTEKISSSNIVHLENEGYDQLSIIFAGSFNTTSNSSQVIYEAGGTSVGTALRIDDVAGQLTFVVSTGDSRDIDISSAININTDYVYIVEITGATDNSAIHLYIAEGTSLSVLDSVAPTSLFITSTTNDLSGSDASGYLSPSNDVQGNATGPLGTAGNFQGTASEILFFSNQSIPNRLPVADAGTVQSVSSGSTVTLDGSGSSDADGQNLSYTWSQIGGTSVMLSDATAAMPTFTAPAISGGSSTEVLTFRLVVNDTIEDSLEDTVVITITAPANTVPTADAGTAQSVSSGSTVTLDGSGSSDAEGDTLIYAWSQVGGSTAGITLSDATAAMPTFTAPTLSIGDSNVVLTFRLVVNDNGGSTEDTVVITITAPANTVPVADAGTAQTVLSGATVTLDGSGSSDAEGDTLIYAWSQVGGPTAGITLSDATASMPTFTAPTLSIGDSNVVLTFRLVVNDNGGSTEDTVVITITAPVNTVPIADAGTAQSVSSGSTVTLDGSGSSDAEGDTLIYAWSQVGGPTAGITLSDSTASMPTFTAPTLSIGASNVVLTFRLVVNDNGGSTEDTVVITITAPVNTVPTADAGVDQNVDSGATVTLDGSGSSAEDSGQSLVSYTWTQLSGPNVTFTPNSPTITFTLPNTLAETDILTFGLVVNDGHADSSMDEVIVSSFNTSLLSGLTLTERISSSNIVHLATEGYDTSSMIFAGKFNTSSNSYQVIYESGGGSVGTSLLIDDVGGQLTFIVSTGDGGDIDISSAIDINTDYVYIVEITGATDNSVINLLIAEGTSFSSLDGVAVISDNITSSTNDLAGSDGPGYLSSDSDVQYRNNAGDFEGTASEILFFSGQSIANRLPVADAGTAQTVSSGETVTLDGSGSSDADGDTLMYAWTQTEGTNVTLSDATASMPTFTAPTVSAGSPASVLTFQLIVSDSSGPSEAVEVVVTVNAPGVESITISPADFDIAENSTGVIGTITATGSSPLNYSVSDATNFSINNSGVLSLLVAQNFELTTSLSVDVTVDNGAGVSSTLTFEITINDVNEAPTAISLTSPSIALPISADTTSNISLTDIVIADDALGMNTISLTGDDASDFVVVGTTLFLRAGTSLSVGDTFDVTVNAVDTSISSSSAVTVDFSLTTVDDTTNIRPIADAGTAQTVSSGETVTLDGSGSSDADGDTLMYAWTQTEGTNVTLSDATASMPTFTAPTVSAGSPASVLTFQLIVSDSSGPSEADTVVITINPPIVITISPADFAIAENSTGVIGTITATGSSPLNYSVSDATNFSISNSGVLSLLVAQNFELTTSLSVDVTVDNGAGVSSTLTFEITINDVNEAQLLYL